MVQYIFKRYFIPILIGLFYLNGIPVSAQDHIIGKWEGIFLDQFQLSIQFEESNGKVHGNLTMKQNEHLIQNDSLVDIEFQDNKCRFYIPDKETSFTGQIIEDPFVLNGNFTFPDGTKHPFLAHKKSISKSTLAQYGNYKNKGWPQKMLFEDLEFLHAKLIDYHPHLKNDQYRDELSIILKQTNEKVRDSMSLTEFYFLASSITDAIGCSHTGLKLPAEYIKLIQNFGQFFPLRLFISNEGVYNVSENVNFDHHIPGGSKILEINGLPIEEIIDHIRVLIPAEENNVTTKSNFINRDFNVLYHYFDQAAAYHITFENNGVIDKTTIPSCTYHNLPWIEKTSHQPDTISFQFLSHHDIGVLKIRSFSIPDMAQYLAKLESIFDQIERNNVSSLILDLRDNQGGHPIFAAQLFSFLVANDFVYFNENKEVEEFTPLYRSMPASEKQYKGKVYVLINGGSLSTTGHLISLLKQHTNAIFIGEAPGSTYRCNDMSKQFLLPHSGLSLNLPTTSFATAVSDIDQMENFKVDFKIQETLEDKRSRNDAYMKFTLSLINSLN